MIEMLRKASIAGLTNRASRLVVNLLCKQNEKNTSISYNNYGNCPVTAMQFPEKKFFKNGY